MENFFIVLIVTAIVVLYVCLRSIIIKELNKKVEENLSSLELKSQKAQGQRDFQQYLKSIDDKGLVSWKGKMENALVKNAPYKCNRYSCVTKGKGDCFFSRTQDYNNKFGHKLGCEFCAFAKVEVMLEIERRKNKH